MKCIVDILAFTKFIRSPLVQMKELCSFCPVKFNIFMASKKDIKCIENIAKVWAVLFWNYWNNVFIHQKDFYFN